MRGIFHAEACGTATAKRPADETEALGETRADEGPFRLDHHASHPSEVGGEGFPEGEHPARVTVAEDRMGHLPERLAERGQPGGPGEGVQCRNAGPEVVLEALVAFLSPARSLPHSGYLGNAGGLALAGHEVPLGQELVIGLNNHTPRDPELA